jgi:hypothetical protein
MFGIITIEDRQSRIRRYLHKKRNKDFSKKHKYKCRANVAVKRLRIKGRFVTKPKALKILGLTKDELFNSEMIQTLLTNYAEDPSSLNSLVID